MPALRFLYQVTANAQMLRTRASDAITSDRSNDHHGAADGAGARKTTGACYGRLTPVSLHHTARAARSAPGRTVGERRTCPDLHCPHWTHAPPRLLLAWGSRGRGF